MSFPLVPQPKKRPALLDKREKAAKVDKTDRVERAKCKARSGGRCEAIETIVIEPEYGSQAPAWLRSRRCERRATENHHLLGGIGRRNRGRSILAEHRIDVCQRCHQEIGGKVLVPCVTRAQAERADSVRYERIR